MVERSRLKRGIAFIASIPLNHDDLARLVGAEISAVLHHVPGIAEETHGIYVVKEIML